MSEAWEILDSIVVLLHLNHSTDFCCCSLSLQYCSCWDWTGYSRRALWHGLDCFAYKPCSRWILGCTRPSCMLLFYRKSLEAFSSFLVFGQTLITSNFELNLSQSSAWTLLIFEVLLVFHQMQMLLFDFFHQWYSWSNMWIRLSWFSSWKFPYIRVQIPQLRYQATFQLDHVEKVDPCNLAIFHFSLC